MESRRAAIAELDSSDAVRDHARAIRARTLARARPAPRHVRDQRRAERRHVSSSPRPATTPSTTSADSPASAASRPSSRASRWSARRSSSTRSSSAAGIEVRRDRPRRVHRPARRRPAVAHRRADHPQDAGSDVRPRVHARSCRPPTTRSPTCRSMTALARRVLRKGFLQADMGITRRQLRRRRDRQRLHPTNEGNGRLYDVAAARPRRAHGHRAASCPPLADLGVMLQVLGPQRAPGRS